MFGQAWQAVAAHAQAQAAAAQQAMDAQQAYAQQQFNHDVHSGGAVLEAVRQPDGSYSIPELIECR